MDEQRFQAYVMLIEQLLGCPQEQEEDLLQANRSLVDAGLVAAMEQVAAHLKSQENGNAAQWLRRFAAQLAEALGLETAATSELGDAGQFLYQTLRLIAESQSDARQIYSFLEQHQDRIDEALLQAVPRIAAWLLTGNPERQQYMAGVMGEFGKFIQQFPLGHRWLNLELCIASYHQALTVITQEVMPVEWVVVMNNLAIAYHSRIRGNRAENLEQAIDICRQVSMVITQEVMPEEWAYTMHNLAIAYADRIRGDRAENLEQAIAAYEQALIVQTQEAMPEEWATTIMNLGLAYSERLRGDRAKNLEQAIELYNRALTVRTQTSRQVEWAQVMVNLAIAYHSRIRGDRGENLERSIELYKHALTVIKQTMMPVEWAQIMMNLGNSYAKRIRGDRAENLEQAIEFYKQALMVRTQREMPVEYALTMMNLGLAYTNRLRGDRAENLEQSIAAYEQTLMVQTQAEMSVASATTMMNLALAYSERIRGNQADNLERAIDLYQQALMVRTQKAMPVEWAQVMMNLANAYAKRIRGDRAENLEQAIEFYKQALTVRTQKAMPVEWAQVMTNLAHTYSLRIRGDRSKNLEQAIKACRNSLEVFEPEIFPHECRKTAQGLGDFYFEQQRWQDASSAYKQALKSAEMLYQSANLLDSKAIELSETANLPRHAAYALARVGDLQGAVFTLECGCARGLSESLERDRSDLTQLQQMHLSLFIQYQDITNQLRNLETQQRSRMTSAERYNLTPEAFRTEALRLRQTLTATIEQIRKVEGYTDFLAQPDFADIQQAVCPDVPLVYLVPISAGSLALIVTQDNIIDAWLDNLTEDSLRGALSNWFTTYTKNQQKWQVWAQVKETHPVWQTFQVNHSRENGQAWSEIEKNHPVFQDAKKTEQTWLDMVAQVTHQLWQSLMAPLIDHLKQHSFQQAILIPTGYLNLLPLHAAWTGSFLQTMRVTLRLRVFQFLLQNLDNEITAIFILDHHFWMTDSAIPTGKRYALDEINFTYAPNARSLNVAAAIAQGTGADSILAIDNPRKDLPNSSREVAAAVATFPQANVLSHEEATVESVLAALPDCNFLHLSCHGTANLNEPLNSGLLMSDGLLTLRQLLDIRLSEQGGIRLAILSACETGLVGFELVDEAIGLPTGLLQAGVAGVIASLWSVSDLSTMMLLMRFYDYWRNESLEPATALRQAQLWIRDTTSQQKATYFKETNPDIFQSLILLDPDYFAHPFHWAAFSYVGV